MFLSRLIRGVASTALHGDDKPKLYNDLERWLFPNMDSRNPFSSSILSVGAGLVLVAILDVGFRYWKVLQSIKWVLKFSLDATFIYTP